jgi:hypothetical protein
MKDYFGKDPVYPPHIFWRRFRMQRCLFLRIIMRFALMTPTLFKNAMWLVF